MTKEIGFSAKFEVAAALVDRVNARQVHTASDHAAMDADLVVIRQLEAALEDEWANDPINVAYKARLAQKSFLARELAQARKDGKQRQLSWEDAQEKARQEAEQALAAELAKDTPPEVVAPMVIVPKTTPTTRSQVRWSYRIKDANAVPRQFCIPDGTLLQSLATRLKGAAQVPGVEFFSRKV